MKENEWKKWLSVVGRMLLAYAVVFAQGAWAAQSQATKDKATSPQKAAALQNDKQPSVTTSAKGHTAQAQGEESESAAEEKPSGDPSHQGIKVHGHWTIEVRNPDGSLATHREFENSYDPNTTLLPSILSRTNSVGLWEVMLNTTAGVSGQAGPLPPCGQSPSNTGCTLEEISWPAAVNNTTTFNTLTVSQNNRTIILSGNVKAPISGAINYVSTENYLCSNTTAPSSPCFSAGSGTPATNFTTFTFPSSMQPVTVSAGQTIQVTVAITFS